MIFRKSIVWEYGNVWCHRNNPLLIIVAIAVPYILIAAVIASLYFGSNAVAQNLEEDIEPASPAELESLVEALVNRNQPPKLAKDSSPIKGITNPPIFDKKYNWNEQRQILKTLNAFPHRKGEDLWPHLVNHLDDKRYSLTGDIDGQAVNLTVGSICWHIVKQDLTQPYRHVWPYNQAFPASEGVLNYARPTWRRTLDEWRGSWKNKTLWELQVELGEWGIEKVESSANASVASTDQSMRGLPKGAMPPMNMYGHPKPESPKIKLTEAEIEIISKTKAIIADLKKTKKPIISHKHKPFFELARYFNEQEADAIREEYLLLSASGPSGLKSSSGGKR